MKRILTIAAAIFASPILFAPASAQANCPAATLADMKGIAPGDFPQQYELSEFEAAAGCKMSFSANPEIEALNSEIAGNPSLPSLSRRIPQEPLVMIPYDSVGKYGGTLNALSNATEAGTSDFLSVRHVNLTRYSDDLQTIVPNVAKSWEWNGDYTRLTFHLRKGHKWSDGEPFTSQDVKFWYDHLMLDGNINKTPREYALVAGEPMKVSAPDPQTVVFDLPAPKPGLLAHFATSYAPGFQPKHFLGRFHPDVDENADANARALGFENGYDAIQAYYGNSDWTDTPTPMLSRPALVAGLEAHTVPTLESHIYTSDTTEGRSLVANPYFFQVDSTGQQLPYISRQDELYINDNEVRILKLVNGEAHYKSQSVQLPSAPLLLENQEKGDYSITLRPRITMGTYGFNVNHEDPEKRKLFGNHRFREAMSIAIDRDSVNEVAFFGQGVPRQYTGFSPLPEYVDAELANYKIEYDPDAANAILDELGAVDVDGDGLRELPNGDKLVLNLNFSTQGVGGREVELVAGSWREVGIDSVVKEVTPDEYRSNQTANKFDVSIWDKGQPVAIVLGNNELWVPPFENYFGQRNGVLWGEWFDSGGSAGIEPPGYVKRLIEDISAFQTSEQGSAEAEALAGRLARAMTESLLFIGVVNSPGPIYRSNKLMNFTDFKTWSYEYYRTYPYRATQWWLNE